MQMRTQAHCGWMLCSIPCFRLASMCLRPRHLHTDPIGCSFVLPTRGGVVFLHFLRYHVRISSRMPPSRPEYREWAWRFMGTAPSTM